MYGGSLLAWTSSIRPMAELFIKIQYYSTYLLVSYSVQLPSFFLSDDVEVVLVGGKKYMWEALCGLKEVFFLLLLLRTIRERVLKPHMLRRCFLFPTYTPTEWMRAFFETQFVSWAQIQAGLPHWSIDINELWKPQLLAKQIFALIYLY